MKSKLRDVNDIKRYIKKGRLSGGAYFKDGVRKVYYVIVLSLSSVHVNFDLLNSFIRKLEDMGLEFEQSLGITIPVVFLKIHIDNYVTKYYLETFDIRQEFISKFDYRSRHTESLFKTHIHGKNVFRGLKNQNLTLMKIKVIHTMLSHVTFGEIRGVAKLKKLGIVLDYYALHDGNIQIEYWHNDELLNDRTLLAKYWANFRVWYKNLPLDLIHKYYGAEVAFHFAWCDFYNKMLAIIAVIGTVLTIIATLLIVYKEPEIVTEVCSSETIVCGRCIQAHGCHMEKLQQFCTEFKIISILDSPLLIFYALLVAIWSMLFSILWRRKESILQSRWNLLQDYEEEYGFRPEFIEIADKIVLENGETIYKLKLIKRYSRYLVGSLGVIFLLLIVFIFNYGKQVLYLIVVVSLEKKDIDSGGLFMSEVHQLLQALFTIVFSKLINFFSTLISDHCCPKTLPGYDALFLLISFIIDLFNNIFPLIHTAFLKNAHYNVPHEIGPIFMLQYDSCDPYACLQSLFVQVLFLFTLKTACDKILVLLWSFGRQIIKSRLEEHLKKTAMPQYEEEYGLNTSGRNIIDAYYSEQAIQYCLILCFVYSCPIATLFLLIYNILSLRMRAIELIHKTRRPALTRRVTGIGYWNGILLQIAICSALINAFITGFLGETIDTMFYSVDNHLTVNYVAKAFSEFRPYEKFGKNRDKPNLPNTCIYRGSFYPPDHPKQYLRTTQYFEITSLKLTFVFIFEILLLAFMVTLPFLISTMPYSIKKLKYIDRTNLVNSYNKEFNKQLELNEEEEEIEPET